MSMTDIDLTDHEKRVLIYLHLVNDANFFPDIKIISRALGLSAEEAEKTVLSLQDRGYVDKRRHYSDKTPDTGGYRAYIADTSAEQSAVDETPHSGGGGEAKEGQGDSEEDTGQRP